MRRAERPGPGQRRFIAIGHGEVWRNIESKPRRAGIAMRVDHPERIAGAPIEIEKHRQSAFGRQQAKARFGRDFGKIELKEKMQRLAGGGVFRPFGGAGEHRAAAEPTVGLRRAMRGEV